MRISPSAKPDSLMFANLRSRKAAMPFIMMTVLIDMIAIGLIIPVLPTLVGSFALSPEDQAYWYGAVTFSFGLSNFLAAPLIGALSDRFGRRPLLLLGFLGMGLSFFVTAMATTIWGLILVRIVSGALQSNFAIANAYAADITAAEHRTQRFGWLGAMIGVGYIVGPAMGGLLGAIHLQLPFFVAGSLAVVNFLYGYFVLPESLSSEQRKPLRWQAANPIGALRDLGRLQGTGRLLGVIGFSTLAQFILYTIWVLYNTFKFGWGPLENGWLLAVAGIVMVVGQGFLLGRLLKIFRPRQLVVLGLISSVAANLLWGLATAGWMMYAIVIANILSTAVTASVQSMISAAADSKSQGQTFGAIGSLNSLMGVVAPAIGAPLLGIVSHLSASDWRIGMPFYFCALLQACALLLAISYFRSPPPAAGKAAN